MNPFMNARGLTLVESIVTSILAVIIGFIIYTVAIVYMNESGTSISRFMMQQQYDNVASQIARDVHRASFVLAEGETPAAHGAGNDTVASVRLFDRSDHEFARYSIVNSMLYEGVQPRQYCAGGGTVQVVGSSSFFVVGPQRKTLRLAMSICRTERNKQYTLSLRKAVFLCRN